MHRTSLFLGMALGAGIAFTGMLIGGLGDDAHAMQDQEGAQGRNGEYDRLVVDELVVRNGFVNALASRNINIMSSKGMPVIELREMTEFGQIRIMNSQRAELVRIGAVLNGGGRITTSFHGRLATEMGSTRLGGEYAIRSLTNPAQARMFIGADTGYIIASNSEGEQTVALPHDPRVNQPMNADPSTDQP